jgi:hypothetical protein
LGADPTIEYSPEDLVDLVRSKLYFAGASARWMFRFSTMTVVEQIEEAVSDVSDIIPYVKGFMGAYRIVLRIILSVLV